MTYTKLFDASPQERETGIQDVGIADSRSPAGYWFDTETDEIELAVNVALAANRPLLVLGESGQGKSSLAAAVAVRMGWRYEEAVVTARTTPDDLLWRVDVVRRLADAHRQTKVNLGFAKYIQPGPLWWAISPKTARVIADIGKLAPANGPQAEPSHPDRSMERSDRPAVLLIDEIDKADPDLPNALLVPLGTFAFTVPALNDRRIAIEKGIEPPLVVITSNKERALPPAFERRCVVLEIKNADKKRLKQIVKARFEKLAPETAETIIDDVLNSHRGKLPSPAEMIDIIEAWQKLEDHYPDDLTRIARFVLGKAE